MAACEVYSSNRNPKHPERRVSIAVYDECVQGNIGFSMEVRTFRDIHGSGLRIGVLTFSFPLN